MVRTNRVPENHRRGKNYGDTTFQWDVTKTMDWSKNAGYTKICDSQSEKWCTLGFSGYPDGRLQQAPDMCRMDTFPSVDFVACDLRTTKKHGYMMLYVI